MNRSRKVSLLILAIILVLGSAAVFLAVKEKGAHFWVSYVSGVAALCAAAFSTWPVSDQSDAPSSYVYTTVSGGYVVAVALVIYFGYIRIRVFPLPIGLYSALHIAALAVYIIVLLLAHSSHRYIADQGAETRRQVVKARMDAERVTLLRDAAGDLPDSSRAQIQKALTEVEEKLRYTDPIPAPGTEEQARAVEQALDELEELMDTVLAGKADSEALDRQCRTTLRKIGAYERAKKIVK